MIAVLQLIETDMTIFCRRLALVDTTPTITDDALLAPLAEAYYRPQTLTAEHRALEFLQKAERVLELTRRVAIAAGGT